MKKLSQIMMLAIMMLLVAAPAAIADDKNAEMTPEFIEEGISKAVASMDNMVTKINELQTIEDVQQMERIINSIEFRNVRKKYGKIELTDEHRERLIEANLRMLQALNDYFNRCGMPFEVREAISQEINEDKIRKEMAKDKTLRDAMS